MKFSWSKCIREASADPARQRHKMPARTSAQIPDDLLIVDPALEAIRKESSKNKVDSSTVSVFLPATVRVRVGLGPGQSKGA